MIQITRVEIPTDTVLSLREVVPTSSPYAGWYVESAPAGLTFSFRIGKNGQPILGRVFAGLLDECDPTTDGLFLDVPVAVAGGLIVVQVILGGALQGGA